MFNLLGMFKSNTSDDIPQEFLMTREEMEQDLYEEYCQADSDMSWDEFLDEMAEIKLMFEGETT